MLFNSLHFLLFFPVVTAAYFILPHKFRWFLLLMASCYFYMVFKPIYILILGFTIVVDYFAGILIENAAGRRRKMFLVMSLVANIGVLAIFKYYNFLNHNLTEFLGIAEVENPIPFLKILLPIGLSFHTFQAMSYTIEVFRGKQKAERHFGIYSLYVMFYPQLVAGPIERPQNLLHQFREKHSFDYERVTDGLKQMAWGMFKKVVIADRLALVVNQVYNSPHDYTGLPLITATVFFAIQIYCDFSGYSDIALGSAKVMGFKLMTNFERPYFARSIAEFWKRWHISLSTWFRDYLYISLGGNRVSIPRWYFNLFIVFVISGLWHGADWCFVIWGALHGAYLIIALVRDKIFPRLKLPGLVDMIITFILADIAWIFFRTGSIPDISSAQRLDNAWYILSHLFSGINLSQITFAVEGFDHWEWTASALLIVFLISFEWLQEKKGSVIQLLKPKPFIVRYLAYEAVLISILLLGKFTSNQFIYFQF